MRIERVGGARKWQEVQRKWKKKKKKRKELCVTAHNNAGDARVVLSNDSQAQWVHNGLQFIAFIIPPSK